MNMGYYSYFVSEYILIHRHIALSAPEKKKFLNHYWFYKFRSRYYYYF